MKNYFVDYATKLLAITSGQLHAAVTLLEEGNTVPFISRYRKEATGNMDEVKVFAAEKLLKQYNELEERKQTILQTIDEQGKLTDELRKHIEATCDMTVLEDIYMPYKPKRRTRAMTARENGLEPLALLILQQKPFAIEAEAEKLVCEAYPLAADVIKGACDIIAEMISEDAGVRESLRRLYVREAIMISKAAKGKEEEGANFRDYFDYSEPMCRSKSHRLMAVMRGEKDGYLKVKVSVDDEKALEIISRKYVRGNNASSKLVAEAAADSFKRLLHPSMESDVRTHYFEIASDEAIKVFSSNLRQLLMLPPLGPARILAIDPGFRTGCKIVCLDEHGMLLHNQTIYPHPPQNEKSMAGKKILTLIEMYKIEVIAIGNGTASRETEYFIKSLRFKNDLRVFMVDESGASVYSASAVARKEFPDYDVTVRGAVSIGRRLMDPLSELIKIDPEAIGVGQYQHDVNTKRMKEELGNVVVSCVNNVGVNVNTASEDLLRFVSGCNAKTAAAIIEYRTRKGGVKSREELKKVKGIGENVFRQAAGFLRVPESVHPLDNTAVHPESYHVVEKIAAEFKSDLKKLVGNTALAAKIIPEKYITADTGSETIKDIVTELLKPGRDPRGKPQMFSFDETIRTIDDLKEGMILPAIVTNMTNFGAFADIGLKISGLIHISEMADKFISSPAEVVSLHQQLQVKVKSVDLERKRIQLTLKF
jgi:uncharacterized protein